MNITRSAAAHWTSPSIFRPPEVLTEVDVIEAEAELKALQRHALEVVDPEAECRRRVGASIRLTFYGIILWVSAPHTRLEIHKRGHYPLQIPATSRANAHHAAIPKIPIARSCNVRRRCRGWLCFGPSFVPYRGTAANRILGALFHTIMSVSCISAYAQGKLEAQYGIAITGVPIGHIAWHVDIGDDVYATSANGKASGVLSLLINGEGSVATSGKI